ncbi:hypothetical protein AA313_de0206558 [Arthrobotrys entomopaga]|nr:hypothetical protein AA313_de0206558 [Arthrobotrys entomopaga]
MLLSQVDRVYSMSFVADPILGCSSMLPPSFLAQLLLIFAIGRSVATSSPNQQTHDIGLGPGSDAYYHKAQNLTDAPEILKSQIREIQNLALCSVYLLSMRRFDKAQVSIDRAMTLAILAGYANINAPLIVRASPESRLKQRLWGSIFYLKWIYFRTVGGKPPTISTRNAQPPTDTSESTGTDTTADAMNNTLMSEADEIDYRLHTRQILLETLTGDRSKEIDAAETLVGFASQNQNSHDVKVTLKGLDVQMLYHEGVILEDGNRFMKQRSREFLLSLFISDDESSGVSTVTSLIDTRKIQEIPPPLLVYLIHTCLLALCELSLRGDNAEDQMQICSQKFDCSSEKVLENLKTLLCELDFDQANKPVEGYYVNFINLILKFIST